MKNFHVLQKCILIMSNWHLFNQTCFVLVQDGITHLYSWGWNEHGMCGTGDEENVLAPQLMHKFKDYHIRVIGCGTGCSFAVAERDENV